jgi:hypothetical protein
MQIVKPSRGKFILSHLDAHNYTKAAYGYSKAKKYGIRGIYAWGSVLGLAGVIKDAAKGIIVQYGKRKFAAVCLAGCAHISAPAILIFTNATKVVNITSHIHSFTSFVFESLEDTSNLTFLPIDMILFGQPIPVGDENRFNILNNVTDFIDGK